jgi:cytochrome c oxidase assembly factor CtaG
LPAATPAWSHDAYGALGNSTTWTYDPWIVVPLYASGLLYYFGTGRIWRHAGHGRGVKHWQAACFWAGWLLLALALTSPLHWLGERLFVAHMVEHEVIMVLAAPLLAIARPVGAFLWALPPALRKALGGIAKTSVVAKPWLVLRDPLVATVLHAGVLWAWHMPRLFNLVLVDITMHRLQHATFFLSAVLFWWSLFYGPLRRRGYGMAVLWLFVTSMQTAALGILITLSRTLWYPQQTEFAGAFGLTPLEDQQLAGLVMWVPAGFVYTGVALFFASRWISTSSAGPARPRGEYAVAR